MASALLERETLDAEDIKVILEGGTLTPLTTPAAETRVVSNEKPVDETESSARPKDIPRVVPPLTDPDAST